jgi:CRP-like cAMP-binding protein
MTCLWYLTRYPYTQLVRPQQDAAYAREFAAGEPIEPVDPNQGESALILISGHIRLVQTGDEARLVTLDVLNPQDILGWLAEPDGETDLQAVSMDHCRMYELPRQIIEERIRSLDLPAIEVASSSLGLGGVLRVDIRDLLFQPAKVRVARSLLLLLGSGSAEEGDSLVPCTPLPVWQLAELAGLGREALRLTLAEWEKAGWVGAAWGRVRAIRPGPLRDKAHRSELGDRARSFPAVREFAAPREKAADLKT